MLPGSSTTPSGPGEAAPRDVVITGIAGVFPGSDNVDELRENLFNKVDLVSEDNCRWKKNNKLGVPNATGKIRHAAKFDAPHFGIHRKQVYSLDPMTCLTLERSYEAICDAGICPSDLKGCNVGVYMGSTFSEADNVFDYEALGDGFGIMGHNRSMLATRVSYYFDVNGPSVTGVTSWCSGLTALSQAYRDLKSGRCVAAIVGAPSLTLFPVMSWHLAQLGVLSPDGKSRAFDDAANGYGRSDAVVVMFLQRAADAKRIYASVVHSQTVCYGDRQNLVSTNHLSMSSMLKRFYDDCGVDPATIAYLEADSCGNKSGDKEEVQAVEEVLLSNRKTPLLIGSVKTNVGHTESASSLVGMTKVLIAMQSGNIPPNLHYKNPSRDIPALTQGKLKVVTDATPWSGGLAAVNCVGMGGNYGHVVLKSYDKKNKVVYDGLPRLVPVSARTQHGVETIFEKLGSTTFNVEQIRLLQDVHASHIVGHIYRGFSILEQGKTPEVKVENYPGQKRPVWFIYSGMGSQWQGMATQLLPLPVFRQAIDKSHDILAPKGLDLVKIITDNDPAIFDNILHCFVGIAAVQIGLTDVLTKLDIKPDGLIGHSVGELGCAYADGCMSAEEVILAAYARGKASNDAKLVNGMMAAIGLGFADVKSMLPPGIEVACHNGPGSCTISGPTVEVESFVAELTSKRIFARAVNVANIAYHSQYIKPAAPKLLELLKEIIPNPKPRSSKWVSTSIPEDKWDSPLAKTCSPEYHTNNLLSSVLFEEGSRHIPQNAITIEVAPHGLLQAILRRSLGQECTNLALTQRGNGKGLEFLLTAIGKLYVLGLQPTVSSLYPPVQFPVSNGTPAISPMLSWDHTEDWPIANVMLRDIIPGERTVLLSTSQEEVQIYAGHSMHGHTVFPAIAFLKLVWELLANVLEEQLNKLPVVFENVRFPETVFIPEKGSFNLYVMKQRGSGDFEVLDDEKRLVLATGRIIVPENVTNEFVSLRSFKNPGTVLSSEEIYTEFEQRGYNYSGAFRAITSTEVNEKGSISQILWQDNWVTFITSMIQQSLLQTGEDSQDVLIPQSIQKLVIDPLHHSATDKSFEVTSHLSTHTLQGGGVQIQGMTTRKLNCPTDTHPDTRIETLQFVPYKNPQLQNVKDFLDICIQIVVENSAASIKRKSNVTVIADGGGQPLFTHIKESLKQYPSIEIHVKTSCTNGNSDDKPKSTAFLVVTSSKFVNNCDKYLSKSGGFLLTRLEESDSWKCDKGFVVVAEQQFGRGKFLLLRKTIFSKESQQLVIQITDGDNTWIKQLRSIIKDHQQEVLLVAKSEPVIGISNFMNHMQKEHGSEFIRCVFILDKSAPKFSLANELYQNQLKQNLVLNIYQDKKWGSIRYLTLGANRVAANEQSGLQLPSLSLEGIELDYLGLNKRNEGDSKKCVLDHIDYSGRQGPRTWVMGVARAGSSKPDPHLMWLVPETWSMEDAATVPLAYATAYYALVLTAGIVRGQRVLIHSGCSSVGQAAIAVALDAGCTVFTTVANIEQRVFLMKLFPKLNASNVYCSENLNFEIQLLLATDGKGAEVILNCLPGRRLQASLRCLASFGHFLQLGQTDLENNSILGMQMFLQSTTFHGIAAGNLFNAPSNRKQALHNLVQEGIDSGVVQPLEQRVFLQQQYDRALGMLADKNQLSRVVVNVRETNRVANSVDADINPKLRCDPNGSYLIIGGKTEQWLDLADWLLQRGARKLVVAQQIEPITNYISRRINLLHKYSNASVVLMSGDAATTSSGAKKLVEEACKHGPLAAIFVLPLMKARESQQNGLWIAGSYALRGVQCVDDASRRCTLQHFVCFACEGAEGVCRVRRAAGLHGLAVAWDSRQPNQATQLRPVLASLDRLLDTSTEPAVSVNPVHKQAVASKLQDINLCLDSFLPASVQDLLELGADLESNVAMKEVVSLSPGSRDVKEVPVVFLVQGLQGLSARVLQPLYSRLMYPVVCINLPPASCQSIEEMATSLAENIRKVQPVGPYNLVGDSWGGALALQLARTLEGRGEKTQTFILEGAPETTKMMARELGEGSLLETNLICRLLNIQSPEIKEEIQALKTFQSKLQRALSTSEVNSLTDVQLLDTAITTIHAHIKALFQFKASGKELAGFVTLVRPLKEENDNCGLFKLCKNSVNVHLVGQDRAAMLSHSQTADIINDNVTV